MAEKRYEAVEIDGRWYIVDHKNPVNLGCRCKDKEDAEVTARVFNLLTAAGIER